MENNKKHLLFIGPISPPFGGVEAINELILNSYLKEEYVIAHLNTRKERGTEYNGRFDFENIKRAFRYFTQLNKILKSQKIDFAYLPLSSTNSGFLRDSVFIIMLQWAGKPIVGHLHGGTFDAFYNNASGLKKVFIKYIFNKINFLIVLSPYWHSFLSKNVSFPEDKIRVIHNSIDDVIYKNCFDRNYNRTSQIKVLFMGNLGQRKGTFDILKAIPEVVKQKHDVKFVFAGTEERLGEMSQIKEICDKEKLNPHTEFLGGIYGDDKINAFKESDIFLLPSYNEGFPIAIVEAMSAGLPIITTPVGGIPDVIKDRQSGLLINPGDYKSIAESILLLINDIELRRNIGEQGRLIAKDNFLKDAFIKKIDEIFQTL